ncbi:hypothetical protein ACWEJ6_49940 [Nonomuraea sp. NPDC004702]
MTGRRPVVPGAGGHLGVKGDRLVRLEAEEGDVGRGETVTGLPEHGLLTAPPKPRLLRDAQVGRHVDVPNPLDSPTAGARDPHRPRPPVAPLTLEPLDGLGGEVRLQRVDEAGVVDVEELAGDRVAGA